MDALKVDSASVGTIIDPSQNQTTKLDETGLVPFSFDLALQGSRVYRKLGIISDGHSETSMTPSIRRQFAISIFSALSLAEISNLSQFSLPIFIQEIGNNRWYAHVGSLNGDTRLLPTVIRLMVKVFHSSSIEVRVAPTTTGYQLKEMIHDREGTPADQMVLVYTLRTNFARLDDTMSLAEQGIKFEDPDARVHMLLRYRALGLSTDEEVMRKPRGIFRTPRFPGG
jgi:hypothetical protein